MFMDEVSACLHLHHVQFYAESHVAFGFMELFGYCLGVSLVLVGILHGGEGGAGRRANEEQWLALPDELLNAPLYFRI